MDDVKKAIAAIDARKKISDQVLLEVAQQVSDNSVI